MSDKPKPYTMQDMEDAKRSDAPEFLQDYDRVCATIEERDALRAEVERLRKVLCQRPWIDGPHILQGEHEADIGQVGVIVEVWEEQKARAERAERELADYRAEFRRPAMTERLERAEALVKELREALEKWSRVVGDFMGGHGGASLADAADAELLKFCRAVLAKAGGGT